jgi:hypothetical protein
VRTDPIETDNTRSVYGVDQPERGQRLCSYTIGASHANTEPQGLVMRLRLLRGAWNTTLQVDKLEIRNVEYR